MPLRQKGDDMNLTKEFRNEKSRRFLAVLMIVALLFSALFPVTA